MNDISGKIVAIKTEVREQSWETMIFECQQSGLSVKEWCNQNGINPRTYCSRLRKLREKVCSEIVPIEAPMAETISEIKITFREIAISLPSNVSQETLTKILMALRSMLKELPLERAVYLVRSAVCILRLPITGCFLTMTSFVNR